MDPYGQPANHRHPPDVIDQNVGCYYQTRYFIIAKTYQREGECEGLRDNCQNCYNFLRGAPDHNPALEQGKSLTFRVGFRVGDSQANFGSVVACILALAFALVCFAINDNKSKVEVAATLGLSRRNL